MLKIKDNNIKDLLLVSFDDNINLIDHMNKEIFYFNNKNSIYSKIIKNLINITDEIYILLVLDIISTKFKQIKIIKIYNLIPTILVHIINEVILKFKTKGDPDYTIEKYKIKCICYLFLIYILEYQD